MMRRGLFVAAASVLMMFSGSSYAQETQTCEGRELVQAGTFEAVAKTVGIIVGARWGGGTLKLNSGNTYIFSFKGAKLLDIGVSETSFAGIVYNLEKIEDFPGTFLGVGGGLTAFTKGLGGVSMTNGKCVVVNAKVGETTGVRATNPIGPGGVLVSLDN